MLTAAAVAFVTLFSDAPPILQDPDVCGDRIAFVSEGDLWVGSLSGGMATRLTSDEGVEMRPRFSPDGAEIVFTAEYSGVRDMYVISSSGGAPRRLSFGDSFAVPMDWSPDGSTILFRSWTPPQTFTLYTMSAKGGLPRRLPMEHGDVGSFSPDGKQIALTRFARSDQAWFRYQGGMKNDIWVADTTDWTFARVASSKFTCESPAWSSAGIAFIQDEGHGFGIYQTTPDGKGAKRLAGPYAEEVRDLSTDGRTLIYTRGISLEAIDVASGKVRDVPIETTSDRPHTMPYRVSAGQVTWDPRIGPSGKRVVLESRGQIISLPASEGAAQVLLAKPGVRYRNPVWSPDAKHLAYFSDESGDQQLMLAQADGGKAVALTKDRSRQLKSIVWSPNSKWLAITDSELRLRLISVDGNVDFEVGRLRGWDGPMCDFSPDSRWLAFESQDPVTFFRRIHLLSIETRQKHEVSDGFSDDRAPAFSSDGKWLVFVSTRNLVPAWDDLVGHLNLSPTAKVVMVALSSETTSPLAPNNDEEKPIEPAPTKSAGATPPPQPVTQIDLDGLYKRWVEVPMASKPYAAVAMVGDRVLAWHSTDGGTVSFYDFKAKRGGDVGPASAFWVTDDLQKLLLITGSRMQVVPVAAESVRPTDGLVSYGNLTIHIDPVAEWRSMYWQAWRYYRDYFYVKNMHGVDWNAVGNKYARFLPSIRSRDDLDLLIFWMQSELNCGHSFIAFGDQRKLRPPAEQAYLGLEVGPDPSGYPKITKVYRGTDMDPTLISPLAMPGSGAKVGEYVIEVAGQSAQGDRSYLEALVGRAGQVVEVKLNAKPEVDGSRSVFVKPTTLQRRMQYYDWVETNRKKVEEMSGGKLGYIHLRAMSSPQYADFVRQFLPQRNREAMIIDIRYNTGGSISSAIMDILRQKVAAYFNMRNNDQPWTRQSEYFLGPMACLINGFCFSNGEEFPDHFRKAKLGKLIGTRTAGGEVGSDPGWPLSDGGRIWVPNYGAWTPEDGWIIEGQGVSPDFVVENDPTAFALGRDLQLERTVEHLLSELRKKPVKRPVTPPDPNRTGSGG